MCDWVGLVMGMVEGEEEGRRCQARRISAGRQEGWAGGVRRTEERVDSDQEEGEGTDLGRRR